ncbi:MAG TPA: alcohol dehydrogenase catalytic domain-containing protein, partial [Actinomycetota bacterium]
MKAVVHSRYGSPDGLEIRDLPTPDPAAGEVLVRVRASSVHPDVWHVVTGRPAVLRLMGAGVRRPRSPVPGTDLAGEVHETGPGVDRFRPGDPVFGEIVRTIQWRNAGAWAEFAAVPADLLAPKPAALTFEEAGAIPTSALIALR